MTALSIVNLCHIVIPQAVSTGKPIYAFPRVFGKLAWMAEGARRAVPTELGQRRGGGRVGGGASGRRRNRGPRHRGAPAGRNPSRR